jgi:uncharacterized protein YybS (DUF2232 family)
VQRLAFIGRFLLASLSSGLLCFTLVIPPAGVALAPLSPQPVLGFGLRYGIAWGLTAMALAIGLFAGFFGEALALVYGLFAVMSGLLFALLGRIRAIEYLVVTVAGVLFIGTAGLLYHFFGSWGAMLADFHSSIMRHVDGALRVQEKLGLSQDSLQALKERTPEVVDTMLQLLPALIFLGLAFMVLINVMLLLRRFPERRAEWLSLQTLREWKGPEFLVWGLIVCGFTMFINGMDWARLIAANLLLVIASCYFAQGLSVIAYFFHKNNVPRFLRGLTYVLIVFQQIFTLLVVGLGLFDLWGDFRRLGKNNLTPSQAA